MNIDFSRITSLPYFKNFPLSPIPDAVVTDAVVKDWVLPVLGTLRIGPWAIETMLFRGDSVTETQVVRLL